MAIPEKFLKLSELQAQNTPLECLDLSQSLASYFQRHEIKTAESLYGFMLGNTARASMLITSLGGDFDAIKRKAQAVIGLEKAQNIESQPTTDYGMGAL